MATASKKTPTTTKTTTAPVAKKTISKTVAAKEKTVATVVAAKKPAAKKIAPIAVAEAKPTKVAAVKKTAPKKKAATISPEHRYHMISTAAYFLAERRGFAGGYEMQDWISAEAQIDTNLGL